jgi:hypothetical protein
VGGGGALVLSWRAHLVIDSSSPTLVPRGCRAHCWPSDFPFCLEGHVDHEIKVSVGKFVGNDHFVLLQPRQIRNRDSVKETK